MNINNISLRDYILTNIPQEDIFAHFLKIDISSIELSIINGSKLSNPLRADINPSVEFRYVKNKLRLCDYGSPFFSGDVFHIGSIVLNKNINDPNDFVLICKYIINNISCRKDKTNVLLNTLRENKTNNRHTSEFKKILMYDRDWSDVDYSYWQIPTSYLSKKGIYPLRAYEIDNNYFALDCSKLTDIGFGYYVSKNKYNQDLVKLYFPYRDKYRFFSNNSLPFDELVPKKHNNLIFIKSKKDATTLSYLLSLLNIPVDIIPLSSESIILDQATMTFYKSRYDKIFTWFDYDSRGVKSGFIYKFLYDTPPIYIGRDPNTIDISERTIKELDRLFNNNNLSFTINDYENFILKYSGEYQTKDLFDLYKEDCAKAVTLIKQISNDNQLQQQNIQS